MLKKTPKKTNDHLPIRCCLSTKRGKGIVSIFTLVMFALQFIIPLNALAARNPRSPGNHLSALNLWKIFSSLPSIPRGVQSVSGIKNPRFAVHHLPDPVNALNGNLFLAYQDFYIPARGFPLELSRSYNSRSTLKGLFGYGWFSSIEENLTEMADGTLHWRGWDGSVKIYHPVPEHRKTVKERKYAPAAPSLEYVIRKEDGSFTRLLAGREKETYSSTGRLTKKEDPYGNGLQLTYDPHGTRPLILADSAGRKVQIAYTPAGLIHAVIDPAGNRILYSYDSNENLIKVTGVLGEVTEFAYDSGHNLTGITFPDGNKVTNVYDSKRDLVLRQEGPGTKKTTYQYQSSGKPGSAQQTFVFDAQGNRTKYTYQFFHKGGVKKLTIEDPMGGKTVEEYDENQNLTRKTDPNGNTTSYLFNKFGWVESITDPMGGVSKLEYQEECGCRQITAIHNTLNQTTMLRYNEKSSITEIINARGHSTVFNYNETGDLAELIAADGGRTRYQYDSHGNLVRVVGPEGNTIQFKYDRMSRMTDLIMPGNHRYQFQYDPKSRLIETINPLGYKVVVSYDPMDRITKIADQEGSFVYQYDVRGLVAKVVDPEGNTVRFEYDHLGNLLKRIDAAKSEWQYAYDKLSRLTQAVDPLGQKSRFGYNSKGNLVEVIDPLNARTVFSYDRNDRLIEMLDPAGNRTRFQYDAAWNLKTMTNAENHQTSYTYDEAGQLLSVTNALGQKMVYVRDKVGNIVKFTDPAGNDTTYQYDLAGRLIKQVDPLGHSISYKYNPSGRLAKIVRPDGITVTFEYNPLNLLSKILPENGPPVLFEYNSRGQLLGTSEGEFAYRYNYTPLGLLKQVQDVARKRTLAYSYDSRHNLVKTEILPEREAITYQYDKLNRMTRLSAFKKDYHFEYDGAGRRISTLFPNKVKATFRYDTPGRLQELLLANPAGKTVNRELYKYNKVGSIISKVDLENRTSQFRYDPLNRLIEARHWDGEVETFAYDPVGNILNKKDSSGQVTYAYNKASQLVSAEGVRLEMGYDANGNLIRREGKEGVSRYTYDDLNRLREITLPDGEKIQYGYSPASQRTLIRSQKEETHLLYDGVNPIATLNRDRKIEGAAVFGPGYDEPLALESKGKTQFFHKNGLGSIIMVSDEKGSPVSQIDYRAFGQPRVQTGSLPPFSFTGRPYNAKTGFINFYFRDYDPRLGRFIQPDPLGIRLGWENPYAYASNNPLNFIDLYGLWGWPSFSQVVGAVAVGAAVVAGGIAIVAAAPVLAAGGGIAAAAAAAGTALGATTVGGAVVGAAGAISTTLGTVGTTAAIIGGAGGALTSAASAATGGKGFFATMGDTLIGGVTGAAAGVIATAAGGYGFLAGVVGGAAGGAAMGGTKAVLTGGDVKQGVYWGAGGGAVGGLLGPFLEGPAEAIKNFGVGAATGGIGDFLENVLGAGSKGQRDNKLQEAIKEPGC